MTYFNKRKMSRNNKLSFLTTKGIDSIISFNKHPQNDTYLKSGTVKKVKSFVNDS